MGEKIHPSFTKESETKQFENEISDIDYDKSVSVCRTPRDRHGHSETISFRVNPMYPRIASELRIKESAFGTLSDFHRTAYRLGCGIILKVIKAKGKIGDQIDDIFIACDDLERITKTNEAYLKLDEVLSQIPKSLKIYAGDRDRLNQEVGRYKERVESLKDAFWRKLLRRKLQQKLNLMEENPFFDDENL